MTTLIIGKNSNLSQHICNILDNGILLSSRELESNISLLDKYKNKKINIIFNNFQTSILLNDISKLHNYLNQSICTNALILDYIQNWDINKIIYTSSSSVYGNNILCSELDELKPLNLHASLKVSNEKLIEKFCETNNIDYTITRVFNMYGGNDKFSIISKIINAVLEKQQLIIINNGNSIRDFIHINDIVSIYIKLLEIEGIKILNIGSGLGTSIKNILDFLLNNNIEICINNIYRKELKISTADITLLNKVVKIDKFKKVEKYLKESLSL